MEDMVRISTQLPLQFAECSVLCAYEVDLSSVPQVGKWLLQPGPFGIRVERIEVGGAGDQHENAERGLNGDGADPAWEVEVANDWSPVRQREEAAGVDVVKELPGEVGKVGAIVQVQSHSQAGVAAFGLVEARGEGGAKLIVKNGIEQSAAELSDRGGLRGVAAADCVPPRPPDTQQEVVELQIGEGLLDRQRTGLPYRGAEHPGAVADAGGGFDE
jgi:hypothetical protein